MTRPEFVIFDCDGVLVDSEGPTNALLRDDLATRGLNLSVDQVMATFMGGTMRGVARRAADMGADIPEGWVEAFYVKMYDMLRRGVPLIEGVEAVLDRLDEAGIGYAVGSNGALEKMAITLGQHAAIYARLQGRIYSAYALGTAKPDPDLFLAAAHDAGVAPGDCAVVEDSPTGCIAARRAGMRCYGYGGHGDGARLAAEGAQVFDRMSDLPGLWGI